MPLRVRLKALAQMAGELVLLADAYLAARLDCRPLMRHAENTAAWLGRSWRRCRADAMTRAYGPGRGLVAVVVNRTTPKKEEHRDR